MAQFVFANNVNTTLGAAASSTATTLTLSSSAGLPASIPSGFYLALTLNDAATRTVFEVVYATAVSGANVTVIRGQEGTGAQNWSVGDYIYASNTAGIMGTTLEQWQGVATVENIITSTGLTLTAANAGTMILFTGSAAATFTLPTSASIPAAQGKIIFRNLGSAPLTVAPASGDSFDFTTTTIQPEQSICLQNAGGTTWRALWNEAGNSGPLRIGNAVSAYQAVALQQAQLSFAALNGNSTEPFNVANGTTGNEAVNYGQFPFNANQTGDLNLPNGAFLQWGYGSVVSSGAGISEGLFTLAEAFPTGPLWAGASYSGPSPPPSASISAAPSGDTQVAIYTNTQSSGTFAVAYWVIGH